MSKVISNVLIKGSFISDDLRKKIIKDVINAGKEQKESSARNFYLNIIHCIQVPGFRLGSEPPVKLLIAEVNNVFKKFNKPYIDLLFAWRNIQFELRNLSKKYIDNNNENIIEADETDIIKHIDQVLLKIRLPEDAEYTEEELRLMITLETLLSEENNSNEEADMVINQDDNMLSKKHYNDLGKWEKVINEILDWPAFNMEWDYLNDFIKELQSIADEKSKERQNIFEPVKELLSKVKFRKEAIEYFNFTEIKEWNINSVNQEEIPDLSCKLIDLDERLIELDNWRIKTYKTAEERKEISNKCDELEEKICTLYEALNSVFNKFNLEEKKICTEEEEINQGLIKRNGENDATRKKSNQVENENQLSESGQSDRKCLEPAAETAVDKESLEKEDKAPERKESSQEEEKPGIEIDDDNESTEENVYNTAQAHSNVWNHKDEKSKIWSLINEGDLPAAYWLALSMEKGTINLSPVPSWLIAAVQGAYWMLHNGSNFVPDLSRIAFNNDTSKMNIENQLMGLSAAIIINLTAPNCGILHWLNCPNNFWNLNKMVNCVKDFSQIGVPLLLDDFSNARSEAQVNNMIQECVKETQIILSTYDKQGFKFYRAKKVIMHLYGSSGYIHSILQNVINKKTSDLDSIKDFLGNWEHTNYVEREIDRIDSELDRQKNNVITGTARDQLLRYIYQTVQVIRKWHNLNEKYNQKDEKWNWHNKRVQEFCEDYKKMLPDVENELVELSKSSNPDGIIAAAGCLYKTFEKIGWYIGIKERISEPAELLSPSWWVRDTNNLQEVLGRRLLWLPEIEHEDNGLISGDEYDKVLEKFLNHDILYRSIKELFGMWVEKQDYRFISLLIQASGDGDESESFNKLYLDTLEGSKAALRVKIQESQSVIEQAIINGIISDEQRDENAELISLILPDNSLNFNKHFKQLDSIQNDLERALEKRLNVLNQRWEELKPQLNKDSRFDTEERNKTEAFINNEFKNKNTRVIEECLAKLYENIERGGHFILADFEKPSSKTIYREYNKARKRISDNINTFDPTLNRLKQAIEKQRTWSIIKFGEMPKSHLQQAGEALNTWSKLMRSKSSLDDSKFNEMLRDILTFIGFVFDKSKNYTENIRNEGNWRLDRVNMSSSDFSRPFPQLGSMTNGIYDVVCIWEKPGADSIGGLLHDSHLDARNLIILYFGRMTDYQRTQLLKMTRKRRMIAAVLDELLLVYLTGIRDERLKTFFHCSLPLSAINPYTPNIAGDVPTEIFYGRKEIVQDLQRQDGSCLVYGGRQMGKSALLRHVMRRFHNPDMKMYAWVEDIKHIGDSLTGTETEQIWSKLRNIFVSMDLIKSSTSTRREKIREQISQYMKNNHDSRVLIMFDEADNFLNRDSLNNFYEVDEIRSLMAETSRRFKVVFAGLHHVQRFQHLPNQPLAHFGYPNLVGPLDSSDAASLVREPLEALGFTLDKACVFCILSYTNYHPGLIQIFCHELVKRLYSQGKTNEDKITQEEIEAVYLNEEVRAKIRERFEWTLALDPRYQVIAWSMIIDQISIKDSYAQKYNSGDLLSFTKDWWPAEFSTMTVDNFRNLLNEMCGLGILVVTANNQFRLRSPNLVRLMGTENDIEYKLLEFGSKPSNIQEDPDSFHALINEKEKIFSPLTFSQIRNINNNRFDVGVITASNALGINRIEDTIKKLIHNTSSENQKGIMQIPDTLHYGTKLNEWIKQAANKWNKMSEAQITLYQFVKTPVKGLDEQIKSVQNFIKENIQRKKKKGLRVYFVLDPAAYWEWLKFDSLVRSELEGKGSVIALCRWNKLGIRQMLECLEKLSNEDTCDKLLDVSGGWPIILETILKRCGDGHDPRQVSDDIKAELLEENRLRSDFINGSGILTDIIIITVLKYLISNNNISQEYVIPDFINTKFTNEECLQGLKFLKQFGLIDQKDDVFSVEPVVQAINVFGVE